MTGKYFEMGVSAVPESETESAALVSTACQADRAAKIFWRDTLWHEMIHACLHQASIEEHPEPIIIAASYGVAGIIRDNPALLFTLIAHFTTKETLTMPDGGLPDPTGTSSKNKKGKTNPKKGKKKTPKKKMSHRSTYLE